MFSEEVGGVGMGRMGARVLERINCVQYGQRHVCSSVTVLVTCLCF